MTCLTAMKDHKEANSGIGGFVGGLILTFVKRIPGEEAFL